MLQAYVSSVSDVSEVCCKCFRGMLQAFVQNVSYVFRYMFASVFYLDVAYVLRMLQEYVPMVLAILALRCSKSSCCKFASVLSRRCICFTHMFQVYVLNVSSASDVCCIQVFHVSEGCSESHGGMARVLVDWARRARCRRMGRARASGRGTWARLGPMDEAMLVLITTPGSRPHGERDEWVAGRSRGRNDRGRVCAQARGEADRGGLCGRLDTRVHLDV